VALFDWQMKIVCRLRMQADELSSIQGHFGTILTKIKVNTASASGLLVPEIPANKLI